MVDCIGFFHLVFPFQVFANLAFFVRPRGPLRANIVKTWLQRQGRAVKVYPIVDWSNRDIHQYLKHHDLPYHPLWERGYVSIGDHHSSSPLTEGLTEQQTRFFGLLRECGLHEPERFSRPAIASEVESAVAAG